MFLKRTKTQWAITIVIAIASVLLGYWLGNH